MKPLIIYIGKDDKIELTKAELEEMLTEAYEQGKSDGTTTINYPNTPYPNTPYPSNTPWWDTTVVYCSSNGGTSE